MTRRWLRRAGAVLGIVLVAAFCATGLSKLTLDTSISSFLPGHDSYRSDYDVDQQSFGADPITVLLTQPGDKHQLTSTTEVQELVRLEGDLAKLPNVSVVYGPGTLLNQLAGSAQDLLATISGQRDGIIQQAQQAALAKGATQAQAQAAGDAAVVPFDQRYGTLLVKGLPAGLPTLRSQSFINAVAFDKTGAARPEFRFVLPSANSAAVLVRPRENLDQADTRSLVAGVRRVVAADHIDKTTVVVSGFPDVLTALGAEVQSETPKLSVIAVIAVALVLLLARIRDLRKPKRALAVLVPLLAAGVAVLMLLAGLGWSGQPASVGLLALMPVLLGVGSDIPIYMSRLHPSRRLLAAALATAAGFLTTALSPVPFVRLLGILLSVGVLLAAVLSFFLPRLAEEDAEAVAGRPAAAGAAAALHEGLAGAAIPAGARTPGSSARPARVVLAVLAVAALVGWVLLPTISLQADPEKLAAGLPAVTNAQVAEQTLGATGEIDVLLRGANVETAAALNWSAQAEQAIIVAHADQLHPILAPSTLLGFLGTNPTAAQIQAAIQLLPQYLLGGTLTADGKVASLSFGLAVGDLGSQQALVSSVRSLLPKPPAGTTVTVTGLPVLASREVALLKSDRLLSNLIGAAVPSLVLLLLLGRGRRTDAVRALLAAGCATGLGFLVLVVSGASFTPLTVALGSLTAAVGCEFTVLLAGRRRSAASNLRAVNMAALTSGVGYLTLSFSSLSFIRDFGIVLTVSVVLAYLTSRLVWRAWPSGATAVPAGPVDAVDLTLDDADTAERVPQEVG